MKTIRSVLSILVLVAMLSGTAAAQSVSRDLPESAQAGSNITVSIAVSVGQSTYYAIDEVVPAGWNVASATGGGDFTSQPGHVKWVVIQGAANTVYTYTVSIPATAAGSISFGPGEYQFEGQTNSSPIGGDTSMRVTPAPEPDFSLSLNQTSIAVTIGLAASLTATLTPAAGYNQVISLNALNLPQGVSAIFMPASSIPPFSSNVSLAADASAAPGAYNITIMARGSDGKQKSIQLALTIKPQPVCGNNIIEDGEECDGANLGQQTCSTIFGSGAEGALSCTPACRLNASLCSRPGQAFNLSLNETSISVARNSIVKISVNVSEIGGYNLTVKLFALLLPYGVSASFSPADAIPPFISDLTISANSSALLGASNITINATGADGRTLLGNLSIEVTRPPVCGNGVIEAGEDCDSTNLGGKTCESVKGTGYRGTLSCAADCTFNTTACIPPPRFNLTVVVNGNGSVESSPAGIDCGATCNASFVNATIVTLTANPSPGFDFENWSGDCSGSSCSINMTGERSVVATFIPEPPPVFQAQCSLSNNIASCSANNASANEPFVLNISAPQTIAITSVRVVPVRAIPSASVTINVGARPAGAPALPAVYQYLFVTSQGLPETYLSSVEITFAVNKTWIDENDIETGTVKLNRLVNNSWLNLSTQKTGEDGNFVYYEATSPGLSIFAVSGVPRPPVCPVCPQNVTGTCTIQPDGRGMRNVTEYVCNALTDYKCQPRSTTESCCPECPQPGQWSACTGGQQTRIVYSCTPQTGYRCVNSTETRGCVSQDIAQAAISQAQASIAQANAQGKDTESAAALLSQAQNELDAGNFEHAKTLADQARVAAETAPAKVVPLPVPLELILPITGAVLAIAVLVILLRRRGRRPAARCYIGGEETALGLKCTACHNTVCIRHARAVGGRIYCERHVPG